MARPIKETPILTGEDAERFVREMQRVEAISPEVRAAYQEKLEREFQEISKRITFCGEESFGTGSSHIREKDGIWAILFWLNIIAVTGKSVEEITRDHWQKYGRSYYMRNDYEIADAELANKLMNDLEVRLPSLAGKTFGAFTVSEAKPFIYNDPVDGSSTKNGLIVYFEDGSRIVYRLSGTGSSGATLRVYLERYETKSFNEDVEKYLEPLADVSREIGEITERTGKTKADLLT